MTEHESDPTTPLPDPQPAVEHTSAFGEPLVDPGEGRRRGRRLRVTVASVIAGGLVAGGATYAVVASRGSAQEVAGVTPITNAPSAPRSGQTLPQPPGLGQNDPFGGSLTDSRGTTAATTQQQVGVVDIYTVLSDGSQAAGTGMVLTSSGEILTNNHVIEDSTHIEAVVVATGARYTATVVGTDAGDDIAVLQLQGVSGLDTVTTDTSGDVAVGDTVTGVGNAGGDGGDPSAASGTVVALDKKITVHSETSTTTEHLSGLIKVDADIISGDSGGPLYNADTEVIGIDTAASSGQANVSGFAIPIATALSIAGDIEAGQTTGGIQLGYPAYLGVYLASPVGTNGAAIVGTRSGSAAASVGIAAGDTITSFAGQHVRSGQQLARLVSGYTPGERVSVGWTDSTGAAHHALVTLGQGPAA